ncbi:MAG TPA: primase-helicase family protein, partial [Candidatus Hodarchaeales archaeon]|nr:primase-helicase family protein [Candidatus Hodarchaeales archaeon]
MTTTRNHSAESHRYRIFLPFDRVVHSVTDYGRIAKELCKKHFPNNDPKVLDGARQFYFSPPDAIQISNWLGEDYDVDAGLTNKENRTVVPNAWTGLLHLTCDDGTMMQAELLDKKVVIHCPFHTDTSASAFADYSKSSGNWFIYCSSCGTTYWKERPDVPMERKCERFYSFGSDVYEAVTLGDKFVFSKVGQKKFYVWTDAFDDQTKNTMFSYLVREKHMPCLTRIDYIGDMGADKTLFRYDSGEGVFTVHHAPLPEKIADNEFIENWLQRLFGEHSVFIKQWMAVYCYTNYLKLPTLILKGPRGTGKNTFAEALMTIYPAISSMWHGEDKTFTPEVQSKLLVADESVSSDEKQYRLLKQRSGQKFARVNEKYVPEYQVKNNMNIIVMSNNHTPIFVRRDELPTSEKNNQFFVHEFPLMNGDLDPEIGQKIEDRLGHYIRTELKTVFAGVEQLKGYRYNIPTPITEAEKALFDVNITALEAEADRFLRKMVTTNDPAMTDFFDLGLFPGSFIDAFSIGRGYTKNGIIRNLKERGYLDATDPVRKMVNKRREYCFQMTEKAVDWLEKEHKLDAAEEKR